MDEEEILRNLKFRGSAEAKEGMARYGITPKETFGTPLPYMRALARDIGRNHGLAQTLWKMGIRETMIVASLIDDPEKVTEQQMEAWVLDLDYWEIIDQVVSNLFSRTEQAFRKAEEWSRREEEFVKRAGFVMMARLAVLHKKAPDAVFEGFLPAIERGATDERNNVKKAVSWALRQIGKRNTALNRKAVQAAKRIKKEDSKAARWVASDVLRELTSEKVQERVRKKG